MVQLLKESRYLTIWLCMPKVWLHMPKMRLHRPKVWLHMPQIWLHMTKVWLPLPKIWLHEPKIRLHMLKLPHGHGTIKWSVQVSTALGSLKYFSDREVSKHTHTHTHRLYPASEAVYRRHTHQAGYHLPHPVLPASQPEHSQAQTRITIMIKRQGYHFINRIVTAEMINHGLEGE